MNTKYAAVTIDGPAGAGKTTMARALAAKLPGFRYVDTGAFYRALACYHEDNPQDGWMNGALKDIDAKSGADGNQLMLIRKNGEWSAIPESRLRSSVISEQASILSANPEVRQVANALIRQYAAGRDVVMEGRDTGSAVLPRADVKFYLTAHPDTRTRRRKRDFMAAGIQKSLSEIRADVDRRDERDMNRPVDPLVVPEGAVEIDNSFIGQDECLKKMLAIVEEKLRASGKDA